MIYEVRTYRLKPHGVPEFMQRFEEGYEHRRKFSEIVGIFHTEIGPLNQVIHIWPYADAGERERIRAESMKGPHWPPKVAHLQIEMLSEIYTPFPFSPTMATGALGPVYEWRSYAIEPGRMADVIDNWSAAIGERAKLSPLAVAMHTETGPLNRFVHVWPYASLQQRSEIRAKAVEMGIWPPQGGAGALAAQENKILLPASFSPMQ